MKSKVIGKFMRMKVVSDEKRLHHAYRHLVDDFGNWNKKNAEKFKKFILDILKNYDKKVIKKEIKGKEKFVRYTKKIDGNIYQVDVYMSGPYKGLLRTVTKIKDE